MQPLDGELSSGGNPLQLLTTIIDETTGDLLWLRPDAWRMPREYGDGQGGHRGRGARAAGRGRSTRSGRWQEAPDTLRARARPASRSG